MNALLACKAKYKLALPESVRGLRRIRLSQADKPHGQDDGDLAPALRRTHLLWRYMVGGSHR